MTWSLANLLAWMAQVSLLIVVAALAGRWFAVRSSRLHLWTLQALLAVCFVLPAVQPWQRPFVRERVAPQRATVSAAPAQAPDTTPMDWESAAFCVIVAGAGLRLSWLALGMFRLRRYRANATPIPAPQGTCVAFARSDEITGPVTFGWLRPIILVPPSFERLPAPQQTAIACHESVHVQRCDWLWSLLEELTAALLWFQPGVWWLLGQIRLTREHVVDAEVVKLTGAREHYVDALLSMASSRWQLDLAPAPLFLKRRHLSGRIRSLVVEDTMSKTKLATSYVAITAALLSAAWIAVGAFPLLGNPQVSNTREPLEGVLTTIDTSALPEPLRGQMESQLSPFRNTNVHAAVMERVVEAALKVAGNLRFDWRREPGGKVALAIHPNPTGGVIGSMARRPDGPQLDFGTSTPAVRIGANVAASKLVSRRAPVLPQQALQARLSGTVRVAALIGKDGHVKQVYTIKGSSILAPAAEEAVMQYVYQPTLLNGNPIDVATTVDVTFELP